MITLKSAHEIELMRRAGKITAAARALAGEMVKPGVTTQEIDSEVERFIRKQGAVPSFLHYNGYPASACISVNDEIIHGIPGKRVLQDGDIVSVDVGAYIGGCWIFRQLSRPMWKATGIPWFGSTSAMASAHRCTRHRRSPTTAIPAGDPVCCGA